MKNNVVAEVNAQLIGKDTLKVHYAVIKLANKFSD